MIKALGQFLTICVLLLAAVAPARAASETEAARDLKSAEDALSATTARQADLARALSQSLKEQEEASAELVALTRTARREEKALADIAMRTEKLNADNAKAMLALAEKRASLGKLLAALQRLDRNPPPPLAVSPADATAALRGALQLKAIVPPLAREAAGLKLALAEVEALHRALDDERAKAVAARDALESTRRNIADRVAARQAMAREQAKGLAVEQATAQTLASTARNLKDLLRRLADERAAAAARLADQERARQEDWQAARAAFKLVPGALLPPVQGRRLHAFAADNGLGRPLQGQILAAMTGEHVLAPADGTVEFAGPFRSYDQLVIINPGAGHLVLLAGMSDISVEQGQSIRAGEPLGTMGDGKSALSLATGLPKPAGPVLYVEIRTGSDPVDPAPWLNNPAAAASAAPISTTASGVADVNNVKVE